jgi:myo-inositol 2-dehydrogenase/D-chiro-inositol 1-dehydrogenase
MERYAAAYRAELQTFVKSLQSGAAMSPSGTDGLKALELADSAVKSMQTGQEVKVSV